MMQVFEHIALANGVDIVNDSGAVTVDTPAMIETARVLQGAGSGQPAR